MFMEIRAAIAHNQEIQKKARDLNVRAGEDVFHIMSRSEWKQWLSERVDGARCSMEVRDFDLLHLPELEPAMVQLVTTENPDTVTIEGISLQIEYGKEYYGGVYVRTNVEEEFARVVQTETVLLPSGRTVEIRCSGHSAKSFKELVEKLEKSRVDRCWSTARSQHETSWTSDSQKVIGWLDKAGSQVEITRTNNGNGDPIYGFVGLKRYSGYSEWQLFMTDTKEKAQEETQKAREVIVKAAVKDLLVVPKEDPWQKSGYWNWELTDLGRALQNRFETLVKEYAEGLTSGNIEEKIEALKAAMEKAKFEIGGEHELTKKIVEEAKASLEGKIDSLEDKNFVKSEIEEARKLIREAEEALAGGSYADAKAKCEKAVEVAGQLAELCNIRSQGKQEAEQARSEVSEELYNLRYGYDQFADASSEERSEADELSREIGNAFSDRRYEVVVAKAEEARGLIARVHERNAKLEEILQAEYVSCPVCGGELYRGNTHYCDSEGQQALMARGEYSGFKVKVSKIGGQELISLVADYSERYNEFEMRLEVNGQLLAEFPNAEITTEGEWREPTAHERELASEISELKLQSAIETAKAGNGSFTEAGGRHFKCGCGCQTRVTKSEWKDYQAGQPLEIHCSVCGADGVVQKVDDAEEKSESKNGGLDVEALKKAWGCK